MSATVRSTAAIGSNAAAAPSATSGVPQPQPAYQATIVEGAMTASRPVGLATLRSAMRAASSVVRRTGSVTSHSRSQSALASSLLPSGARKLVTNSSASCSDSARATGAL